MEDAIDIHEIKPTPQLDASSLLISFPNEIACANKCFVGDNYVEAKAHNDLLGEMLATGEFPEYVEIFQADKQKYAARCEDECPRHREWAKQEVQRLKELSKQETALEQIHTAADKLRYLIKEESSEKSSVYGIHGSPYSVRFDNEQREQDQFIHAQVMRVKGKNRESFGPRFTIDLSRLSVLAHRHAGQDVRVFDAMAQKHREQLGIVIFDGLYTKMTDSGGALKTVAGQDAEVFYQHVRK